MANAVALGGSAVLKREQRGQKQRRAAFQKERRKRKRQALAKLRDSELQEDESREVSDNGDDEEEERKVEEERQRLHQEWLRREELAQEEFRLKTEREEAARKKREEEEKRIKEEWEEQQRKEKEERERKAQEKMDRETEILAALLVPAASGGDNEAVQKMLDQAESQLEGAGPWKNPEAPVDYGTEKDRANCPFFLKTGACRFGDRCSRVHVRPASSTTLMVKGMFVTFSMEQSQRDDYDTDASLEYSEDDVHQNFLEFYQDVLPEFRNVGKVVQFKVSCNFEPHLRGNVYIQYETEEQCREAFVTFNGRWYAGRQLQCEFSPVTRWKTAICGLFDRNRCPKGKHCNFLHVYRNPTREFWEADRDLHTSPNGAISRRFSERFSERRDGSSRHHDYSPERSGSRRWRGRLGGRRSRSRERRWSRSRERRQSRSTERRRSRSTERRRSRSTERRRSRSTERRRSRSTERRRSRSTERRRSRSKEGRSCREEGRSRRESRRSRSRDRRSRSRDGESRDKYHSGRSSLQERRSGREHRSPSWSRDGHRDGTDKSPTRQTTSPEGEKRRRSGTGSPKAADRKDKKHKRSKKSSKKKKSKKKKREKSRSVSPGGSSRGSAGEGTGEGTGDQPLSPPGTENTEAPEARVHPVEPHLLQQGGGETQQEAESNTQQNPSPPLSVSLLSAVLS